MFKKMMLGLMSFAIVVVAGAAVLPVQAAAPDAAAFTGASVLTSQETSGLLHMYEEEKLAHDAYAALYGIWNQAIFQTIAASEQVHMEAIHSLLVRYNIPVPQTAAGVFEDASLQSLYNRLIVSGRASLAEALKVGASIEEVDISDLQSRLAQTSQADIQLVYKNLMQGSYNHLRSFTGVFTRLTGELYQPQYLNPGLYQTILSGASQSGRNGLNVNPGVGMGNRHGRP